MLKKYGPLMLALMINGAGHAYFAISIPAIGRVLAIADLNIGLLLSIPALLLIVTGPIWGRLCDSIGRKKVLFVGLLTSGVAMLLIAMLVNHTELLSVAAISSYFFVIRILHAALSAGLKPATQALVSDVTPQQQRIKGMSVMGVMFGLGTIMGGVIAMLSGGQYLFWGFAVLAILMLLTSLWLLIQLPETKPSEKHDDSHTLSSGRRWQAYPLYLLTTLTTITTYSALQPIINWQLQDVFGQSPDQAIRFTGAVMMSSMLAMIIAQGCIIRFTLNPYRTHLCGFTVAIISLVLCGIATTPVLLLLSTALLGLAFGILLPSNLALMTNITKAEYQGQLAGFNGMSQGMGMAIGPVAGSIFYQSSPVLMFQVSAICLLVIATALIIRQTRVPQLHT